MLGKVFFQSTLLSCFTFAATQSFADVPLAPLKGEDLPNVLVVKTKVKGMGPDQQLHEEAQAELKPIQMELPLDEYGDVDLDKLIATADQHEDSIESVYVNQAEFDSSQIPGAVMDEFTQAELDDFDDSKQRLRWRFYRPYTGRNSGFYGYSHYPYWGYNNRYRSYYPSYGYYRNNSLYRYNWAYNRYRRGHNYNYYYYRR